MGMTLREIPIIEYCAPERQSLAPSLHRDRGQKLTRKLLAKYFHQNGMPFVGLVRPQESHVVLTVLRNCLEAFFIVKKRDYLLLGNGSQAIDVLALAGTSHSSNGVTTEDAEVDTFSTQYTVQRDRGVVKTSLYHVGDSREKKVSRQVGNSMRQEQSGDEGFNMASIEQMGLSADEEAAKRASQWLQLQTGSVHQRLGR
jgi:hypothetical protein